MDYIVLSILNHLVWPKNSLTNWISLRHRTVASCYRVIFSTGIHVNLNLKNQVYVKYLVQSPWGSTCQSISLGPLQVLNPPMRKRLKKLSTLPLNKMRRRKLLSLIKITLIVLRSNPHLKRRVTSWQLLKLRSKLWKKRRNLSHLRLMNLSEELRWVILKVM